MIGRLRWCDGLYDDADSVIDSIKKYLEDDRDENLNGLDDTDNRNDETDSVVDNISNDEENILNDLDDDTNNIPNNAKYNLNYNINISPIIDGIKNNLDDDTDDKEDDSKDAQNMFPNNQYDYVADDQLDITKFNSEDESDHKIQILIQLQNTQKRE